MIYYNKQVSCKTMILADFVINKKLVDAGGSGGLIALEKNGNIALPFNTKGMYRGYVREGERVVKIYKE